MEMQQLVEDVRMEKVFGKWVRIIVQSELDRKSVQRPINRQAARCSICDAWTRCPTRCERCGIVEYCSETCVRRDTTEVATHIVYCLSPDSIPLPVEERYIPSQSALFLMAIAVVQGNRTFFIRDPVARAKEVELVFHAGWGDAKPATLIMLPNTPASDSVYQYPHLYDEEWMLRASNHFYHDHKDFDYWSDAENVYKQHPLSVNGKVTDINHDLPTSGKLFTIRSSVVPAVKAQLSLIYDKLGTAKFRNGKLRFLSAENAFMVGRRHTIFGLYELIRVLFNRYVIDIPIGAHYEFDPTDYWMEDEDMQIEDWFDTEKRLWMTRASNSLPQNELVLELQATGWRIECVSKELRELVNGPRPVVD